MDRITIEWLLNLIGASPSPRDHAKLIEVMKSIRDGQISNLTAQFSAVAAGLFALIVGFGTLLYRNVTDQFETGSVSVDSDTGTTFTKIFSGRSWEAADTIIVVAMLLVGFALMTFLIANRLKASEIERSYSNAVTLYFFLSRQLP